LSAFKTAYRFCIHFLTARNTKGFGIHSPFVFNFVQYVLYEKHPYYVFQKIEEVRKSLLSNHNLINVTDLGAGKSRLRKVSDIASKSLKRKKYAQLLFRIGHYFKAQNILELGTSFGITTAYLASVSSTSKVVTLEGCTETLKIAGNNFRKLGFDNVQMIEGNIDTTLFSTLDNFDKLDFVFIDANHRNEALISYFEQCLRKIHKTSVIVIDDINWSEGMLQAWEKIKLHNRVTSTIDLFELGIVFFNSDLVKKHYKIRY